jgi:hypothetical protein
MWRTSLSEITNSQSVYFATNEFVFHTAGNAMVDGLSKGQREFGKYKR